MNVILNYIHDPMCSWCWAYRPVLERVRTQLPTRIRWNNVLGGLAPDSLIPMPLETREMVQGHWRRIQREIGTAFNFDFWTLCEPRRSTYIACRAVIAATAQNKEEEMILAIQKAYYLNARNPSEQETLVTLAAELNLDAAQFESDLLSPETDKALKKQIETTRRWPVSGFPSFVLVTGDIIQPIPLDYKDATVTLSTIRHLAGTFIDNRSIPQ